MPAQAWIDSQSVEQYLGFISGATPGDDLLVTDRLIAAAQNQIERLLGYRVLDLYGGENQDAVPPALVQAGCMLVAHWFEQRETAAERGLSEVPFGVQDIVAEFREFTF